MSRKNFAKGIDAILGDSEEASKTYSEISSFKGNKKEKFLRTSLYVDIETYEQLKALAYWDRRSLTSLVNEAFALYVESKGKKYVSDAVKKYAESQEEKNM